MFAGDESVGSGEVVTEYEYGMARYQAETLPPLIAEMERELENKPGDALLVERLARTREHLRKVRHTIASYEDARREV